MNDFLKHEVAVQQVLLGGLIVLVLFGSGAFAAKNAWSKREMAVEAERATFASSSAAYQAQIQELSERVASLISELDGESARNDEYDEQVRSLAYTVDKLERLSKTDRELLAKYSNVYFLSENFVPAPLAEIDPQYVAREGTTLQIHSAIKHKLESMMQKAAEDGSPLRVLSSYRSFGTQAGLKQSYSVTYGKGTANQFSADQGYSEHQLASTVDFTSPENPESLAAFEKSAGFSWLKAHAHEYGFILSYPKGNEFFQYEPWHWRYVGVDLATRLHVEGKNFYDLDQREINTYLVRIFD